MAAMRSRPVITPASWRPFVWPQHAIISNPFWPAEPFFAYDKLGSVAIIASAAGFIRTAPKILLPMHDMEKLFPIQAS
jgi:hypothetical protein